jgi:hypothetical protein
MKNIDCYFQGTLIPDDIKQSHLKDAVGVLKGESKAQAPFGKVQLMMYIDKFGDFFQKKGPVALICQAIYDSLSADDQHAVMEYLMEMEDTDD